MSGFVIEQTNYTQAGLARYDGGGAVIHLTDAPAYGVALPADPSGSGDMRTIRGIDLVVSAPGIFTTYNADVATAANGFPQDTESWRSVSRSEVVNWQFYVPVGVKLYVRYLWGSR